jgi:hypothetical protein
MPNVTFNSAVLRSFSRNGKGGSAAFTTNLTAHVCKAMDWNPEIPDCLTNAKPEGELVASSVELIPEQKDMQKQAVSLGVCNVTGFEIVRREMEGNRGKGHRLELRFSVGFQDANGCARLETYMQTIGAAKGKLNVSYQRKAQQESLISEDQAADTAVED